MTRTLLRGEGCRCAVVMPHYGAEACPCGPVVEFEGLRGLSACPSPPPTRVLLPPSWWPCRPGRWRPGISSIVAGAAHLPLICLSLRPPVPISWAFSIGSQALQYCPLAHWGVAGERADLCDGNLKMMTT